MEKQIMERNLAALSLFQSAKKLRAELNDIELRTESVI